MHGFTRRHGRNSEPMWAIPQWPAIAVSSWLYGMLYLMVPGFHGTAQAVQRPQLGAVAVPVIAAPRTPLPQEATAPLTINESVPQQTEVDTVGSNPPGVPPSAPSGILTPSQRTSPRYFMDPFWRSGCPQNVRRFAIPSTQPNQYSGGYVGGGVPFFGEGRYPDEGTWAIDYDGVLGKRVWLLWTHGRRYQGGTEGYKTDGPRIVHHR